ncbi:MAG: MBL fold metallo-hydrolase [Myxococcaceae bacterium]
MRLRILGCSGGELPRHRTTCFLVDGVLAVDAGALTTTLSLDELLRVDDIVLTHSHFDHVKDVPLLADLLVGRRRSSLRVHASTECARTLRRNVFNDRLWPDFTRIPDRRNPVVRILSFDPARPFRAGKYAVHPVPVCHPVESVGLVISNGRSAFAVSGDTGPTTRFWRKVNRSRNLKALLVEMSFPNGLQGLADLSGHLTPNTLATELTKLDRNGCPVYLYHLKPAYAAELRRELAALKLDGVRILSMGDEFVL